MKYILFCAVFLFGATSFATNLDIEGENYTVQYNVVHWAEDSFGNMSEEIKGQIKIHQIKKYLDKRITQSKCFKKYIGLFTDKLEDGEFPIFKFKDAEIFNIELLNQFKKDIMDDVNLAIAYLGKIAFTISKYSAENYVKLSHYKPSGTELFTKKRKYKELHKKKFGTPQTTLLCKKPLTEDAKKKQRIQRNIRKKEALNNKKAGTPQTTLLYKKKPTKNKKTEDEKN